MKRFLFLAVLLSGCASLTKAIEETQWPWEDETPVVADPNLPPAVTPTPHPDAAKSGCPGPANRIGFDIIGLMNARMDAKGIADQLPPNVPVGWLDGTFGMDLANVKTVLDSGRVSIAIPTILNTVAPRNMQAVDSDGPLKGMNSKQVDQKLQDADGTFKSYVQSRVAVYKELATHYPCTNFIVKPALEHDLSEKAYKNLANWVNEVWPGVRQINNPYKGWAGSYLGSKLEKHGENPKGAQVSSLDGKDLYDIDRAAWRNRTEGQEYTLSWTKKANCRPGAWTPPTTRTECVTRDSFKEWLANTYN